MCHFKLGSKRENNRNKVKVIGLKWNYMIYIAGFFPFRIALLLNLEESIIRRHAVTEEIPFLKGKFVIGYFPVDFAFLFLKIFLLVHHTKITAV